MLIRRRRRKRIVVRKLRQRAIEFARETRARECGIEFGNGLNRKAQRPEICAQALGQFVEDARNFRRFVLGKLHEPVVVLDGFKRLDENGLAGRAGGVHDALHLSPLGRAHRNDEAVVAQRDVIFARVAAASAQHALERFLNRLARAAHAGANAPQFGRSVVADFSVGQDGAANGRRERAKIRNGTGARGEQRKLPGGGAGTGAAHFRERNRAAWQPCPRATPHRAAWAA